MTSESHSAWAMTSHSSLFQFFVRVVPNPRAAWRLPRARMAHYDLGTIRAWVTSGDVG
jgi:hypothetical protein